MKKKHRTEEELRNLLHRLNRVEGQVRGVKKMLEEERYCVDIFVQIAAIQAALNAFNTELLCSHVHTCVADGIREGREEAVDELCELIKKLMK